MVYFIIFEDKALQYVKKITKSGNRADKKKLELILEELKTSPFKGLGKPEPLKYNLSRFWSRRLNKKDRIIYQVIEEPDKTVVIISALGHY
jgi:toxin YoeB